MAAEFLSLLSSKEGRASVFSAMRKSDEWLKTAMVEKHNQDDRRNRLKARRQAVREVNTAA